MVDLSALVWAFAAGAAVAVFYLVLLWRAVARLAGAARPAPALLVGGALRVAVVVAALVAMTGGAPLELLAALASFTSVRFVATRRASRQQLAPVGR